MSMASGCDVLSARQKPLQVEDPGVVQLLTDYGKFRVEELKSGKNIPPALARRMKMLVNQEYKIFEHCKNFQEACEELGAACDMADILPDEQLRSMLARVQDHFNDLIQCNEQRRDNVNGIIIEEKENLEKFRQLHDDIDLERKTSGVLSGCTAATGLAVGIAVACPVTILGATLFGVASGLASAEHRARAMHVQNSVIKDMEAKNVPIQYMETLATSLDDSMERLGLDAARISGRSARIKRRVDMILEEIQGVRMAALENCLKLARDPILMANFGPTENRRLQLVQREAVAAGVSF